MTILSLILSKQEGTDDNQLMMYNTENLPFVCDTFSAEQFQEKMETLAQALALGANAVAAVLPADKWSEVSAEDVPATGLANVIGMSVYAASTFDSEVALQEFLVDFFADVSAKLPDLQAQYRVELAAQEKALQDAQSAQAEAVRTKVAEVFAKYVFEKSKDDESAPIEAELVSE